MTPGGSRRRALEVVSPGAGAAGNRSRGVWTSASPGDAGSGVSWSRVEGRPSGGVFIELAAAVLPRVHGRVGFLFPLPNQECWSLLATVCWVDINNLRIYVAL